MMNFQFNVSELIFVLPELFLLSAISIILLFDLFASERLKPLTYYLTQLALIITGWLAFDLIGESAIIFSGTFVLDTMGSTFKVFIMGFAIIALVYTRHYLKAHELLRNEYFILALMSILGMMVMVSGHSLLTLYMGLEIMSLSLYALIASARDRAVAIEAALKYFVLGAIASGLLLYGMSMIYGITGSLDIAQISNFARASTLASQQTLILNFGLVFLVIGVRRLAGAGHVVSSLLIIVGKPHIKQTK
jgi:NADH-quinone oxidoreductase subunit N